MMFKDDSPRPDDSDRFKQLAWFVWKNYTLFVEPRPNDCDVARREIDNCLDQMVLLRR
jgi:hypothetical protein